MKRLPYGHVRIKPLQEDTIAVHSERRFEEIGEVIEVYTDVLSEVAVEVGDKILFDSYAYRHFEWEGEDYYIVDLTGGGYWGTI